MNFNIKGFLQLDITPLIYPFTIDGWVKVNPLGGRIKVGIIYLNLLLKVVYYLNKKEG